MDIICPTCREPWENDSLHEEADARKKRKRSNERQGATFTLGVTYDEVAADFGKRGCKALVNGFGPQPSCTPKAGDQGARDTLALLYETVGDDMDAAADEIESLGRMGLL